MIKDTQSKKLCNILLNSIGNISKTRHVPVKVIFSFSNCRINNHEKLLLYEVLRSSIPQKTLNVLIAYCLVNYYLGILIV